MLLQDLLVPLIWGPVIVLGCYFYYKFVIKPSHDREFDRLESKYEELKASHEELRQDYERLKLENQNLRAQNEQLIHENHILQQQIEALRGWLIALLVVSIPAILMLVIALIQVSS